MTRKLTAAKMSKHGDRRNFFGKRNAETDQEPSSISCSGSDKLESSQKPAPKKMGISYLRFWLDRHKWLRYENDLMFWRCVWSRELSSCPTKGCDCLIKPLASKL